MKAPHDSTMRSISETLRGELNAADAAFSDALTKFYTPNGTAIDDNDVRLLQSGIELTIDELSLLCVKHCENPTMLRLLDKFCAEHEIESDNLKEDAARFIRQAKSAGSDEIAIWREFQQLAGNPVRMAQHGATGETYTTCADRLEAYTADALERLNALHA